jgi:hypothetical protein
MPGQWSLVVRLLLLFAGTISLSAAPTELKDLSVNGGIQDGKARLIIEAQLAGLTGDKNTLLFASTLTQVITIGPTKITHAINVTIDILQGTPNELVFTLGGDGEITKVTGEALQDWSVRQETNGTRSLVLRPRKTDKPLSELKVSIAAEREAQTWRNPVRPLTIAPVQAVLGNGYVKVEFAPELDVQPANPSGVVPIENSFLPEAIRSTAGRDEAEPLAYRFHGTAYSVPLNITLADPEARRVVLHDFQLRGRLSNTVAQFTLTATAKVKNPRGASIALLSGGVALTELAPQPDWRIRFEQGRFLLVFDKPGEYPLRLRFNATVRPTGGWNHLDFRVASSTMLPVTFEGLGVDTQFEFQGAARPERRGGEFTSFLPPDGAVKLAWKETPPETEGKLFYSAEMLSQITISPGLMRQLSVFEGKVMQGELTRLVLRLRGEGSITRIQGPNVLRWEIPPDPRSDERRVVVEFNQPQKEAFSFQVQMQTELGTFPQAVNAMRLEPTNATRFAGFFRVVNEGAVRLEVVQATGLSQISPEQFPETETTRSLFAAQGNQRFAFRFSSPEFALRVQADNVLPELSVSQLLAYHLGETELAIDGELELDIREAPVRELLLRVPRGFALARLNGPGIADYFTTDNATEPDVELRLVYGQPVLGRQVIQFRLERNAALGAATWALPRIELTRAKSTRGHVAVSADAGFRLTPERTQGLTEIATAFFPRKLAGIQSAFRISEPNWQAGLRVERLPQSIQADVFHLFSIGEGIGYGSSTINYVISGAPLGTFRVELSDEYFNVEFTGKDVRNWQKTTNGYIVQLHTPVAGPYTLLATYERPFKSQGDTLTFTGARPLDAQNEQGHTLVVSAYQFQVESVNVSPGLLALEPAEVPGEYRLFSDAPILAAYRYATRPFNLQLKLTRLVQGDTVSLVVDRATFVTRISKDGEVVTDARFFIKNRGNTHLRVTLPEGTELWSATMNGVRAVPVKDGPVNLIPLGQSADPNTVQTLDLKLASRSRTPTRVVVGAPVIQAPVLLADWKLEPDTGQRLIYRRGSLAPVDGIVDASGFAGLARMFKGPAGGEAIVQLVAILLLLAMALATWRWATREGTPKFSVRHLGGGFTGLAAFLLAMVVLLMMMDRVRAYQQYVPRGLSFLAPVQQSGISERNSPLTLEVSNEKDEATLWNSAGKAWPLLGALVVWAYALLTSRQWLRPVAVIAGWTLLGWAALRWPNGAPYFFEVVLAFLLIHLLWPALRRLNAVPPRPAPASGESSALAPAATALMVGALLCGWQSTAAENRPEHFSAPVLFAQASQTSRTESNRTRRPEPSAASALRTRETPLAESVIQRIRVEEKFIFATARIRWHAVKDRVLPIVYEPAIVTALNYPSNEVSLVQSMVEGKRAFQLMAKQDATVDIEVQYQLQVTRKDGESGFALPTQHGVVNRVTLNLVDLNAEVMSPSAVSIEATKPTAERSVPRTNSEYELVLLPVKEPWIGWKPRSRDARLEKPVFFAEILHLFVPAAGVIEGVHQVEVRPAQGELTELTFEVPAGATVTDVLDPARAGLITEGKPADAKRPAPPPLISLWRFDPDARKLRVSLNPPQSRPFTIVVRSQVAAGPLPFEQTVGLLSVTNAESQVGLIGVATGNEVQLDSVTAAGFSAINLEDFPASTLSSLKEQVAGLTVRRAFRYADPKGTFAIKAAPVEPDVRVETQETLSLGEDRTVLAANLSISVTRAGIFRLSFILPPGLDVESISGDAMSHWTELASADGRVITMHLKSRTEGQHQFAISLSGAGTRSTNGYVVPRLAVREAGKQRGQLVIVPEQGIRLQVGSRDGVTQLDPQKSGIRQKGVLAFRLLQSPWTLTLDLERVDAWVQVTSLQHVTVAEAQVRLAVNLQYQIENTGLKAMHVRIPTNAESVRFRGEQVADFLPMAGTLTNGMQTWEVKLHRRVLGRYLLQLTCQTPVASQATNTIVPGIEALDVNLQRGFVTVQSGGRLQVRVDRLPPALQSTEWQSIPRGLQQDMPSAAANYAFRLVEPAYTLPLTLERHEAARLLPARVSATTLTSVVSDDGVMLTQVRLEMIPGDKPTLEVKLPANAEFWFAFVNQSGVWPWRQQDAILIPLEQQSRADTPVTVELFYSSRIGERARRELDLELAGPKFDLPLENITWQVHLNEKWRLHRWKGTLQLEEESTIPVSVAIDVQGYLQNEAAQNRDKTKQAETLLSLGNSLLEKGDPAQARRAFRSAFGLSTHDSAFNEDARVQLHNLKLQQALLGLNVRQNAAAGESDPATPAAATAGKLDELRNRKEAAYTQQEAKQIMEGNTAEQNDAFMRVAERLVQQQDAAVAAPAAIRAAIPHQGRVLTFKRAVQVGTFADLHLTLEAKSVHVAPWTAKFVMMVGMFALLSLFTWAARGLRTNNPV